MAPSVRRLINPTRHRSDDVYETHAQSPSSSPPSRKQKSALQRPQNVSHGLGTEAPTESSPVQRTKPLKISSPLFPDAAAEETSISVMSGSVTRSATVLHRRDAGDTSIWTSQPMRKPLSGTRSQQRMKPPLLMHQRPFKAGKVLVRSGSFRHVPQRPPRPDEALPRLPSRRPSLKSVGSDTFIQTWSSKRVSRATSDPGSICINRSRDFLEEEPDSAVSEELRNFILEADQAFRLGGGPDSALSKQQKKIRKPEPLSQPVPTTPYAAAQRPAIPRKSVGSGASVRRTSSTSRPLKPSITTTSGHITGDLSGGHDAAPAMLCTTVPSPSRPKTIQKKMPSTAKMPRKKVSWEARLEAKSSRWGLSEGVTDILTGQRFKKIEADELLTPERVEKVRAQRERQRLAEAELHSKMEIEQSNHWIDIAFDNLEEDGPGLSPSQSKSSSPDVDHSFPSTPPSDNSKKPKGDAGDEIPIVFRKPSYDAALQPKETRVLDPVHDPLPPTPPPKSRRRKLNKSAYLTALRSKNSSEDHMERLRVPNLARPGSSDSVYTNSSFSPGPATPLTRSKHQSRISATEDGSKIYLRGTPYTFTRPAFGHGAITFSKVEMSNGTWKMDETLDWTAFQMAILGGTGDVSDVVEDLEDSKLAEELVTWFDGHGFEDWGRIVMEEDALAEKDDGLALTSPLASKAKTMKKRQRSTASVSGPTASSPAPSIDSYYVRTNRLSRPGVTPPPLNIRRKQPPLPTLTSQGMPSNDGSLDSARASLSHTKSPARAPAVVGGGGPGDVEEDEADAPMGFNLSHDLGEYLQWEAEYAYAKDL